ncbi:MAG: hypothetical protein ACMXYL_05015 [Candidatus Woesearchaeota archaeon]
MVNNISAYKIAIYAVIGSFILAGALVIITLFNHYYLYPLEIQRTLFMIYTLYSLISIAIIIMIYRGFFFLAREYESWGFLRIAIAVLVLELLGRVVRYAYESINYLNTMDFRLYHTVMGLNIPISRDLIVLYSGTLLLIFGIGLYKSNIPLKTIVPLGIVHIIYSIAHLLSTIPIIRLFIPILYIILIVLTIRAFMEAVTAATNKTRVSKDEKEPIGFLNNKGNDVIVKEKTKPQRRLTTNRKAANKKAAKNSPIKRQNTDKTAK